MELELGITDPQAIETAIALTGASLLEELKLIPGIAGNDTAWEIVVGAGQIAYAESYRVRTLLSQSFPIRYRQRVVRHVSGLSGRLYSRDLSCYSISYIIKAMLTPDLRSGCIWSALPLAG